MKRCIKWFSILFSTLLLFAMLLPLVFADVDSDGVNHSRLPEPVPMDYVKYFVVQNPSNGHALLFMFSLDINASTEDELSRSIDVEVDNLVNLNVSIFVRNVPDVLLPYTYVYLCIFDVATGAYQGYAKLSAFNNNTYGFYSYQNNNLSTYTAFLSYGCAFSNPAHWTAAKIDWSGQSTYNYQYTLVNNALNAIRYQITHLDQLTNDEIIIIQQFYTWASQTFYPYIQNEFGDLQDKLDEIISLLGGDYESSTIDQPEQSEDIDELVSAEAAIQSDVGSQINSAFSNYGQVFSGNGAFALIKSGFEAFILDNSKINALIVFCLTLGIGVLIIGRKIQA